MSASRRGLFAKLKYRFDNFMSKGGLSVFSALMLVFFLSFLLMAAVRFLVNSLSPDNGFDSFWAQAWRSFLQIADAGCLGEDTDYGVFNKGVGVLTIFVGLILFSSLVAFITSQFEAKLDELKKGKSSIIEKNHTLILGFGDRVLEIIRELVVANESERKATVAVLSAREKDEMDDFFRERLTDRKTTKLVTRSGSTSSISTLDRMAVKYAKSVIILNDAQVDDDSHSKELADSRVLKTIMAVVACTGEDNIPPIAAEIHLESKRALAKNISPNVTIIDEHSLLAKLMVQTSRISGLAQVYDNLVGFDGCEFYFYQPEGGFSGITYHDLIFHFSVCSVLGIRKKDGTVCLNPLPSTVLEEGDEAILVAEDDSVIKYLKKKVEVPAVDAKPAASQKKNIENQLIVGWSIKTPIIIDKYSNYLIEGSMIDVVVSEITDEIKSEFEAVKAKHTPIKMNLIAADIHDSEVVKNLRPENYDNVILLSGDGGDAEVRDSETIAQLLGFRHYFKNLAKKDIKTQLITEVADSDNIDLIKEVGVKDFLISNQFISKIYAQISEEPAVYDIYDDLFKAEGSEVYIKPAEYFFSSFPVEISFAEICEAAIMRNETCFGVRLASEEDDASKNYGIYVNPEKSQKFTITKNDWFITLAEDES
ncbi:MAG: hypothetical protein KBH06_03710 [Spirochaetes bacterium]|nr:hypothetical protein [Spirochaetota bacterium]